MKLDRSGEVAASGAETSGVTAAAGAFGSLVVGRKGGSVEGYA